MLGHQTRHDVSPSVDGMLRDLAADVRSRQRRHDKFGWAYDIASNSLIIAGVVATAVAGVSAAADLLGNALVGAIAMAAAILTAVGAALPWSDRAAAHWCVASSYYRLADDISFAIVEYNESPHQDLATWQTRFDDFHARMDEFDRASADIALRGSDTAKGSARSDAKARAGRLDATQ
jgi:hypothetical protein